MVQCSGQTHQARHAQLPPVNDDLEAKSFRKRIHRARPILQRDRNYFEVVAAGQYARTNHWTAASHCLASLRGIREARCHDSHYDQYVQDIVDDASSACVRSGRWEAAVMLLRSYDVHRGFLGHEASAGSLNLHQAPSRQKRHEVGMGIGANGRWRQSLAYFTFLVHLGMRLYQPYYSVTMHSCGEALLWTWSLELLQHLCLSKIAVDRQSPQHVAPFEQVAHACRQAGTRSSALNALKILQTARRLSAATWILHVKVMGACSRSGDWASALWVLEQVGVDGVRPNLRTYTAALTASGIQLSWESAAFLLDSIKSSELHPAQETFDRVLETCRKVSSWAPALAYLRHMRRSNLAPDAIRFASAARALLNKNMVDQALAVLGEMRQCNLDVDVSARIVFTAGMGASAGSMAWKRAVHLLCQFNAVGFEADVQLLCAAASACRRADNWRDVLYLLGVGGIELDITAHNVAVSSCACVLQWQWASNLLSTELRRGDKVKGPAT
ncbi:unnamed protein product [Symbiodinium sp. CCMP2456]|nr:unnamed protein product [Symbiodinium sp. CCMP2456]